ncbi:hypothetical protein [Rhodococcus erythropolis]|uniref:hypothetical protein n=1 Tax=Rhodococcus erythropolis TaxID=1833 RepID=UPI0021C2313F|nr:hypothetical protein [Rhodococcus erythropolis]
MASLLTKKIDSIRSSGDKQPAHNGADPDSPPDLTTRARVRRRPIYLAIGVALVVVAVIGMLAAVSAMRATTTSSSSRATSNRAKSSNRRTSR